MSLAKSEKLKATLKEIKTEIHQLLDSPQQPEMPYPISLDFASERFQIEAADREEFLILLFSRMANYFEKGFLLEKTDELGAVEWRCPLYFAKGQVYMIEAPLLAEFPVPSPGALNVYRAIPSQWTLTNIEWQNLIPQQNEWTTLIFEVASDSRFMFCTTLAEPWLKIHTEKAHQLIQKALTELP